MQKESLLFFSFPSERPSVQTSTKWNLFQLCRVQQEEGEAKLRPQVNVTNPEEHAV